jgi:hypothetical protein
MNKARKKETEKEEGEKKTELNKQTKREGR